MPGVNLVQRAKCLFENVDGHTLPPLWDKKDGSELAGQTVRLRFYLRDAKVYSVVARPTKTAR